MNIIERIVNKVENKFNLVLESNDKEYIENYKDLFENKEEFIEKLFDGSEENIVGDSCKDESDLYDYLCKEDFNEEENEILLNKLDLLFDKYNNKF